MYKTCISSTIRRWLNSDFYNTAFRKFEKELIDLTLVDNSITSTNVTENIYICNDTEDYVFLLSAKEAQTYFSDNNGAAASTSYAKCQGIYKYTIDGVDYSSWWFRTPQSDKCYNALSVNYNGSIVGYNNQRTFVGVRPALYINL